MSSNVDFANQAPGAEGYNAQHPAAAHLTIIDHAKGLVDIGDRKKIASHILLIASALLSKRHHGRCATVNRWTCENPCS